MPIARLFDMQVILWVAGSLSALVLLTAFVCYRMAFFANRRKDPSKDEIQIPKGKIYEPFRETMEQWIREVRAMNPKEYTVTSFDGLTLHAKFYEFAPGAPMEIMFHGYRGTAERDLSGGVQRCFRLGRSAFIVDQRCSGKSEGHTITFGIREHRHCLTWLDFLIGEFGPQVRVLLTGISMGASTVLIAAGRPLPEQVIGVLADCGFSSAKAIICKVIRQMKLPAGLLYLFVRLGASIYGGFDLEEVSPVEAVRQCGVPVLFFHGEEDDFVPCSMSWENYEACACRKELITVPGAGHGLSYLMNQERYIRQVREFFGPKSVS